MSRRKKPPSYRLHKQSGQAIVTLPDGAGGRRDVLLGPYDSPESRAEYGRVIAEWEANGRRPPTVAAAGQNDLSLGELLLAYWRHAEEHYKGADGEPTNELHECKRACRPLNHLYGHTAAREFGPLALKAVRDLMINGYEHPQYGPQEALARGVVNQRVGRIKRLFRWAVENELVPPGVFQALAAVRGLQRNRSKARETQPVPPVAVDVVEVTLPFLNRHLAAMVRVQLLTGARPGEACRMRGCDIDMTGKVWLYRPGSDRGPEGQHKTAHHGHQRVIAIGPRAQEIIRSFLKTDPRAYLFSPREALEELRAEKRGKRKTKVQPSQQSRRKKNPRKAPGQRYTVSSYDHAIRTACAKADRAAREKAEKAGEEVPADKVFVPSWHPHQLRHTKATEIRREAGLDAARVVLGHRSPQVTEVYAEIDVNKAIDVMERLG
jgi:integrase